LKAKAKEEKMNILDEIVAHKREELKTRKSSVPVRKLETSDFFERKTFSLKEFVRRKDRSGIIAEFKRRSPSRGIINANASVEETTRAYAAAGASGLSILTDEKFFGGRNEDLSIARQTNDCPILRKDFTIDNYQVVEAKAIGADAILLIAAVLSPRESRDLALFAHSLGLEVLLEVHNKVELVENLDAGADLIGVNNRDLKSFAVSIDVSKELAALIPDEVVKVSESGISDAGTILELRKYGFEGFLIGENFMKAADPGNAAAKFISQLNRNVVSKR
jgi:indole-3-glycerol phosphate synthase